MEKCSACGHRAKVVRGSRQFTECGLSNVVLHGAETIRCSKCGNEDLVIHRMNDLMRLLAAAVVSKPYPLKGEDVRFVRKFLGMTADEFSKLIHIDKTNLSKWENERDPIGAQSDRLIRLVAIALGDGLKGKLSDVVKSFPKIQEEPAEIRIEMNPAEKSFEYWKAA